MGQGPRPQAIRVRRFRTKDNDIWFLWTPVSSVSRLSTEFVPPLHSIEVQALFEKDLWSAEDFLQLPRVPKNKRQGIYANFATGSIAHQREVGCDAYVGSSCRLQKRIKDHLAMARNNSVESLPEKFCRSFYYKQICRDLVTPEFRLLAALESPIEGGYLLLLEGIFMILLDTYKYPSYITTYAPQATYDLTKSIREHLNLPRIDWRGMNAAWPLRQGFCNRIARSESACLNPACDRMTYPFNKRPEDYPLYRRVAAVLGNPLGGYLHYMCRIPKVAQSPSRR